MKFLEKYEYVEKAANRIEIIMMHGDADYLCTYSIDNPEPSENDKKYLNEIINHLSFWYYQKPESNKRIERKEEIEAEFMITGDVYGTMPILDKLYYIYNGKAYLIFDRFTEWWKMKDKERDSKNK